MMWAIAGKHSAAYLDVRERKLVLNRLGELIKARGLKMGFANKPANVKPELSPLMGKIGALLADMKLPWKYAAAIAKRQTSAQGKGIDRLEWLNAAQLHDVVAALVKKQQQGVPK